MKRWMLVLAAWVPANAGGARAVGDADAPLANPVVFVGQPKLGFGFGGYAGGGAYGRGFGAPIVRTTGSNLFRLDPNGTVTNLTQRANATVRNPDVSYDGTRILYAMALGVGGSWQIHEIGADGSGDRLVSRDASFNDLDPAYLPDGRIVFTSDRQRFVDPYVQLPSAQLHVMEADGAGVVRLSSNPGGESSPAVTSTGEISFIRWDVRIAEPSLGPQTLDVSRFLLWRMNPDGTNDGHPSFGPHAVRDFSGGFFQARELRDGTGRFVAITTSDFYYVNAGALVRLDPAGSQDAHRAEFLDGAAASHGSGFGTGWRDPYPLADGRLLASWAPASVGTPIDFVGPDDPSAPSFGLVVANADGTGRRTLRDDPDVWEWEPAEVAARARPPVIASSLDRTKPVGILNAMDVTLRGRNPFVAEPDQQGPVPDRAGLRVRIFRGRRGNGVYGFPNYGRVEPVLLGEAPVHEDGSFAAVVPAGIPLLWEVVDEAGTPLVRERFWNHVQPGQTQTCHGCHSPHTGAVGRTTNAALAAPAALVPDDSLTALAMTAVEDARSAVLAARSLLADAAAASFPTRGPERHLARAERGLGRADSRMAEGRLLDVIRFGQTATRLAQSVSAKLRPAPRALRGRDVLAELDAPDSRSVRFS